MKRAVVLFAILLAIGVLSGALIGLRAPTNEIAPRAMRAGQPAEWEAYGYRTFYNKDVPEVYDLVLPSKPPARGGYHARVLYNFQPGAANYHYVEITSKSVSLGRVESGIELGAVTRSIEDPLRGKPEVVLHYRGDRVALVVGDEVLLRAYGEGFTGGHLVYGATEGGMVFDLAAARVLKADRDINFADDFMKGGTEASGSVWQAISGSWQLASVENVSLSSNAFWYVGVATGSPAASIAGNRYWSNYVYEVSCKPTGPHPIGIYFYWRDPDNYYLFRWGANTEATKFGKRELIKVQNGRKTVLASEEGGFRPGQWYQLGVAVSDDRAVVTVDDHVMFSAEDSGLCYGKVGLYNESPMPALYDDVYVSRHRQMQETFERPIAGRWQPLGGQWSIVAGGPADPNSQIANHLYAVTTQGPAKAVAGTDAWRDYTVQAAVQNWTAGEVGLTFYYLDEENHYLLGWGQDGTVRLVRRLHGEDKTLSAAQAPIGKKLSHQLLAKLDDGTICVYLDGARVLEQWDMGIARGRAGLYAKGVDGAAFDNVMVDFKPQPEPVLTINEVHSKELTMESWAARQSDWIAKPEAVGEQAMNASWHRADFFGDTEVDLDMEMAPQQGNEVRVVVSADAERLNSGYSLVLKHGSGLDAELWRRDKPVAKAKLEANTAGLSVRLKRKGSFLLAYANGEPLINFHDPLPLQGSRVACASSAGAIDVEKIKVFSDSVAIDRFSRAPANWRIAGGIWETTNRWECDPRWSFFSGRGDQLAAIWHRNEFGGDVTLEFAGAIKMDRNRGNSYQYAADLNMTICADGRDLTSGYSFVFGGWDDKYTRILRGTQVLASTSDKVIPRTSNIHRQWFYLKAEKKGNRLAFYIDNELVLHAEDPKPLTGTRCAIWTWNNGITVGRVRIASSAPGGTESPDFKLPPYCRCVYK